MKVEVFVFFIARMHFTFFMVNFLFFFVLNITASFTAVV
jgi:hypothetical protein